MKFGSGTAIAFAIALGAIGAASAEPAPVALNGGALTVYGGNVTGNLQLSVQGPGSYASTSAVSPGLQNWLLPNGAPDGRYTYVLIDPTSSGGAGKGERIASGSFLVQGGVIVLHAERPFEREMEGGAE